MDSSPTAPPETVLADVVLPLVDEWRKLSPAAAAVRAIAGALSGVLISIAVAAILIAALPLGMVLGLGLFLCVALAGAASGAWLGHLRWKKTRWKLDAIGLHVRRGLFWHTEVLVPRSRVQHLDIERGPLERQFTLATLIVHTAGTDTHALRLSGLDEPDAVTLRDALIPDVARHVDAL